jgi:HSP20 family protein
MALIRFSPWTDIEALRHQMDEIFDEFTGLKTYKDAVNWQPAIELVNKDEALILKASLPGLEAKDLDISVTREAVQLSGEHRYEKEEKEKGYYHSEFRYGKFERTINLPVPIQNDKVVAEFKNGILTLTLPKVEEVVNRVVKVNLGGEEQSVLDTPVAS